MITDKDAPRTETHPVCMLRGIQMSQQAGENVSGHNFVQINETEPAVLQCRVCGEISE